MPTGARSKIPDKGMLRKQGGKLLTMMQRKVQIKKVQSLYRKMGVEIPAKNLKNMSVASAGLFKRPHHEPLRENARLCLVTV